MVSSQTFSRRKRKKTEKRNPIAWHQLFSARDSGSTKVELTTANFAPDQIGTAGYIGFFFDLAGDTHYGWARLTAASGSPGVLHDWAYNNVADEGIVIGQLVAAPEPSRAVLLLAGMLSMLLRRRR